MPVMGLTNGASPVMSFNYGEKTYERVKKAIWFITGVCCVYTLAAWGILQVIPEFFIHLFNNEPELVERGIPPCIYISSVCVHGAAVYRTERVRGIGKSEESHVFLPVPQSDHRSPPDHPSAYGGKSGGGGVFWAEPISNLVGGCASFFTMLITVMPELKERKKEKDKDPGTGAICAVSVPGSFCFEMFSEMDLRSGPALDAVLGFFQGG